MGDMVMLSLDIATLMSTVPWERVQLRLMPSLDIMDITVIPMDIMDIPFTILLPLKLDMKPISLETALSVSNRHIWSEKGQLNLDIMDIPMDSMDTLIMLDTML